MDLHLHSPGVPTFTLPAGLTTEKKDLEQIVDQYVQQLADQGIQIGAITDYQGLRTEWFDAIRTKAGEFGIVILPGTEVSLKVGKYGLHILAIFAYDTPPEKINQALTALDRNPTEPLIRDDGSHRDIDPRDNYKDAILRLKNQFAPPPLLIVAHPTDSNGLLKSLSPREAAEFIRDVQPDAIEGPLSEGDKRRLISTSILRRDQLERIAVVKNLGNAPAQNVFMHVFLPSGRITRYNVVSQELYRVKENKLSEGEIGIWLDRLGSGAAVSIYIWGVQSGTSQGLIDISVTSDRGCAFPDDKPTVIEEVKSYGDFIIQEFLAGIRYILEQEDIRSLRDFPFVQRILFLAQNRDFQAAIIAMALIVGGCWLFLGRRSALIAIGILIMFFIILYI